MQESGKNCLAKAHQITYALFRLAANIKERSFAEKLREEGLSLLGSAASQNYEETLRALTALEHFTKFGLDLNMMSAANADILLREIYDLDAMATEAIRAPKSEDIDISKFFKKTELQRGFEPLRKEESAIEPQVINQEAANEEESGNNINGILKAAIRQNTILERIRQTGNCRLRDIQEVLPDCSERTIRYDLQSLMEQNLIERIGNGGPSVYYRARQAVG